MKHIFFHCLLVLLPVCCFSDDFRLESRSGVPLILQNGKPVSSRMVYVSKTAQEVASATPEWSDFSLPFSILQSCDNASLHLRFFSMAFQKKPENICISKLEVVDAATGKTVKNYRFDTEKVDPAIDYWCTGKWNKGKRRPDPVRFVNRNLPDAPEGALCIESNGDPTGKLGEFHLIISGIPVRKERDYLVRGRIRADRQQNLTASLYKQKPAPFPLTYPGTSLKQQVKLAREAGVNFVTFPVDSVWPEPGKEADYSVLNRICRMILEVNPHARLIPRVDLRVPPEWWRKRYPGEMMKFTSGGNGGYPSVSSLRYRRDAAEALRGMIRFCETHFKDNMAGYHPTGGNTHEWFYYRSQRRILSGYDDATRSAWRGFLRRRYGSDQNLRAAWRMPDASLDSAEIPPSDVRRRNRRKSLLSPSADRMMIDFNFFLQQEMSDAVLTLARVVREETGKSRLCVFFYGYLFELSAIANGPACSGHYALRRILASPDIDILAGPISYLDRQPGGGTTTMTAAESILLAGKLWLNEDDTSTHTAYRNGNRAPGWKTGAMTVLESLALLRRNLAVATFRGFGVWWMDLFGAGWFTDPVLWDLMRRFEPLDSAMRNLPEPVVPQIAEIVDENSLLYLAPAGFERNYNSAVTGPLVKYGRADRGRIGASLGQYLLDDLLNGTIRSELNIITSAWALNGSQRRKLRAISAAVPAFWCWAPGYLDLDTGNFSLEAVEETTGFQVRRLEGETFTIRPTKAGLKFGLSDNVSYATREAADPILSPVPRNGDVVLAEYRSGAPAILLRPGKVPALFCGTTLVPAGLYRSFAACAGVHLYTDRPAYVQKRGKYLSICAPVQGHYEINTGTDGAVTDFLSGKTIGSGPKLKLFFNKGETRIFKL